MNSLKRQAAKAERYGALRDELRQRLRVVIARAISHDGRGRRGRRSGTRAADDEIDGMTQRIAAMDQQRATAVAEGYSREQQAREAATSANNASVELERDAGGS